MLHASRTALEQRIVDTQEELASLLANLSDGLQDGVPSIADHIGTAHVQVTVLQRRLAEEYRRLTGNTL